MDVHILGEKGSGRRTFLALLYTSLTEYSADKGRDISVYFDPETRKQISPLYMGLESGIWPSEEIVGRIEFLLGFKKSLIMRLFGREYTKIRCLLVIHDTSHLPWIGSGSVVILLDGARLREGGQVVENDEKMAAIVSSLPQNVKISFFVTKYDMLSPQDLEKTGLPSFESFPIENRKRNLYLKLLLKKFYPKTLERIVTRKGMKIYVSFLKCQLNSKGELVPLVKKREKGGWALIYSQSEYIAFINTLRPKLFNPSKA